MKRTNDRQALIIVGLIFLGLMMIFGVRLYHFYHVYLNYEFPLAASDIESLTIFDNRFLQKKEITRQEDIAEFVDAVNNIKVHSMTGLEITRHKRTYLCFRLKDGSQLPCACIYGDIGHFSDGSVQVSGSSSFDIWDYWDRMDYEIQENAGAELAQVMLAFQENLQQGE